MATLRDEQGLPRIMEMLHRPRRNASVFTYTVRYLVELAPIFQTFAIGCPMSEVTQAITDRIAAAPPDMGFPECVFGELTQEVLNGAEVVLFGAGSLGRELCAALNGHGVLPACFCDSDQSKAGSVVCGIPVIGLDELRAEHKEAVIVVATRTYSESVTQLLLENGFSRDRIVCHATRKNIDLAFLYSNAITQAYVSELRKCDQSSLLSMLGAGRYESAYSLFADHESRDLFIAKLAFIVSIGNVGLFGDFITGFSEPFQEFGFNSSVAYPESYYYFNNDVLSFSRNEVYVDVGAFDGDTIEAFVQACDKLAIMYEHIYAFEPDPECHRSLLDNTSQYRDVSYHRIGVWSESGIHSFRSSGHSVHDQAAAISGDGDIRIQVVSLDDFLGETDVSFIKMDPGGNVIPKAIKGAARTIARCKPKLAVGAYHAIQSIYEIPLLVHSICPDYRLYLRHNSYHLCDTVLYATV